MKDDFYTPDPRNPFVVPGQGNPEPKTRRTPPELPVPSTTESRRQGSTNHNPFVWVVPNKPTRPGQEVDLDNESPHPTREHSPAVPTLVSSDGDGDHDSTQINNNDALDRLVQPVGQDPTQYPKTEVHSNPTGLTHPNPNHGYVRLLEDHDEFADDDPFILNGHSEDESVPPDDDSFIWTGPVETGDRDATLGDATRVTVDDGGVYAVDSTRLREGVQIGTVKRELLDYRPRSKRRTPRQQSRPPFSPQIPKILDFLTKWRIGTTVQLARVAGWKDSNEQRVLKKLRGYDEVGFLRETNLYAGPKIWTATTRGAEFGFHPWLGGVKASEINPMSQSHSFGLSSIASWLLCPWDTTPNILGLAPDEWSQVRGEITTGAAYVLSEKEYRSSYSAIRTTRAGLLPAEYRHGFIGYGGHENPITGAWREWARSYKNGASTLDESPELLACDPEFMGAGLWMWIIWGNAVWNPKVLEDRAAGDGIDLDDPEWSGRDGGARLRSEFRQYGFVDIEDRLDIASNKPVINKELGDRFALWDHLPDMIIARRRTPDGRPQSIAIELELSAKSILDYTRTMASYGSTLGQTLYRKVIWLVSSKTIADRIRAGASQVGMILGEDYDIVPFVTSNKVSVIKRSFYSGDDILPGRWSKRGIIEPCEADGRSIPLS